jgi:hypothetical protein
MCLVLLVAFGGSILNSLYLLKNGPGAMPHISSARWSIGIVQEATALFLLGYVLSRRGLTFNSLGFRWSLRGLGVGVLVTGLSYVTYALSPQSFKPSTMQFIALWQLVLPQMTSSRILLR